MEKKDKRKIKAYKRKYITQVLKNTVKFETKSIFSILGATLLSLIATLPISLLTSSIIMFIYLAVNINAVNVNFGLIPGIDFVCFLVGAVLFPDLGGPGFHYFLETMGDIVDTTCDMGEEIKEAYKKIKNSKDIHSLLLADNNVMSNNDIIKTEYDEEIQKLVDKINEVSLITPEVIRSGINNKVNDLLSKYRTKLEESKSPSDDDHDIIKLETEDLDVLRRQAIVDLELMLSLTIEPIADLTKTVNELNEYKQLIKDGVETQSEENTVQGNIQNIIYYSTKMDKQRKQMFLERLNNYLSEVIDNLISEMFKLTERKLIFSEPPEYNIENQLLKFKFNVSSLYDEVSSEYKEIKPYIDIQNVCNFKVEKENSATDIQNIINSIIVMTSRLSNDTFKNVLNEELKKILNHYNEIISSILSAEKLDTQIDPKKIEIDLKNDLQAFLLNNFINYVNNDNNIDNIIRQLKESKTILEKMSICEIIEPNAGNEITNYIIGQLNSLLSNQSLDEDHKKFIIEGLNDKIIQIENYLAFQNPSTLASYGIKDILSSLEDALVPLNKKGIKLQ